METYNHLWFTVSELPFWFWFWVLVSLVVMFMVGKALGVTMLALVIYNLTVWTPSPTWLPGMFKLAVLIALLGIVWGYFAANGLNRLMAQLGAFFALVIALILMNGHVLGLVDKADVASRNSDVPGIGTTTLDDLQSDFDDLRLKRVAKENEFERRITRLSRNNAAQTGQIESLEDEVDTLQGRVTTLQDLLDDHMHEKIGQPHYVDK